MSELSGHLGELMGQSEAERLAAEQAATHPALAQAATQPPPPVAEGVSAAAPAAATPEPVTTVVDAAAQAGHHAALADYAFPFRSAEVFGLLPHSIGGKAEGLWQLVSGLSGHASATSLAMSGILIGVAAIAAISTMRVWRRGDEFAVAGFGDRRSRVGMRYTVRQEAPLGAFADKRGQVMPVRKGVESSDKAELPVGPALPTLESKAAEPSPEEAEPISPPPVAEARETQIDVKDPKAVVATPVIAVNEPKKANEPKRVSEPKPPKVVRRQLFKRSANTASYAGSFLGSYGSFHEADRFFARDYLRQTNDAFEAAFLKGKGPTFGALSQGDSHRAERLFMMATRASYEEPQSALAALWQAVEEDQTDAVAWLRLAHFYLELGEFDKARKILEPLKEHGEQHELSIIVAAAANSLARIAAQRGEIEPARKLFAQALEHAEKTDNPYMLGVASANAGLLEASRRKLEPASRLLARGIDRFDVCDERVSAARTKLALGTVQLALGDEASAHRVWSEAEETLRQAGLEDDAAQAARWLIGEAPPSLVTI